MRHLTKLRGVDLRACASQEWPGRRVFSIYVVTGADDLQAPASLLSTVT